MFLDLAVGLKAHAASLICLIRPSHCANRFQLALFWCPPKRAARRRMLEDEFASADELFAARATLTHT